MQQTLINDMRILLLIAFSPLFSFAQYTNDFKPNDKLGYKARVISDSGIIKGYFVLAADSSVVMSSNKRYSNNNTMIIPVNTIKKLQVKNKSGLNVLDVTIATVLSFTLVAGLTNNGGDITDDGETSFFELLIAAIEGTTSSNRKRRNTALIGGAIGGTAMMVAMLFSNKKFTLVFPLNNRNNYYNQRKAELNKYSKF